MKRKCLAGITSVALPIFVQDTTSTTGGGLGSLVFNTAGLVAEYRRQGQSTWTAITLVAGTLGTYLSGSFILDGALTGAYEFCPPDAAFSSGARWVNIRLRGAANMLPVLIEIELDAVNYQDATRFGLSALPNAAANATSGLYVIGGTGVTLAAAAIQAVWDALATAFVTVGSIGKYLLDNVGTLLTQTANAASSAASANSNASTAAGTAATINTKIGTPVASVAADVAAVKTDTANQLLMTTGTGTARRFTVPALANAPTGGGGSGGGDTDVDHNTPTADGLRYTYGSGAGMVGIDGATVRAYTLADYAAGNRTLPYVEGQATTGIVGGVSGRWLTPIRLTSNSGSNSYLLEFTHPQYRTVTNALSL